MKKYIAIKVLAVLIGIFTMFGTLGCEDFLDKAPDAALPEDSVFTSPRLFKKYVDGIYPYLWYSPSSNWTTYAFGGFCRLQMASLEDASDLSDGARPDAGPRTSFNIGNWYGGNGTVAETIWPWEGAYKAIRICNRIIENVDNISGLTTNEHAEIKGQAYFFRGFFHFEMVKRYGGVPYIKKSFLVTDNMDFARDTYDDCITYISQDLDSAAKYLPVQFPTTEFGRPEKGAAMAIKARAVLYAASPLNNPANTLEKWENAAKACHDVMTLKDSTGLVNRYSLVTKANYTNLFYGVPQTTETIFSRNGGPGGYANSDLSFPGWGSMSLGIGARPWSDEWGSTSCPTQNLIDLYETAQGHKVIADYSNYDGINPTINSAAVADGYVDLTTSMYNNRDPRLKITFLLNGMPWLDATAGIQLYFDETGKGGAHMGEGINWTRTGYLEKKFWDPNVSPTTGSTYLNYSFIRYTDIIVMYAEAMNEAFGPDVDGLGYGLTARQAINMVRNRVGHVDVVAANQQELRERIQNERAIEFVYEDLRWFDVIRWNKGVDVFNKPVYGIKTIKKADGTFTYERKKIQDRIFRDYMHRYPIPQTELDKSLNLKNNPGWEVEE
jgi:hypothetical protein